MTTNPNDYFTAVAAIRRTAAGFRASRTVPAHGLIRAACNLEQAEKLIRQFHDEPISIGLEASLAGFHVRASSLREVAEWAKSEDSRGLISFTASLLDRAADTLEETLLSHKLARSAA